MKKGGGGKKAGGRIKKKKKNEKRDKKNLKCSKKKKRGGRNYGPGSGGGPPLIFKILSLRSVKRRLIFIFLLCSFAPLLLLRFVAFPKAQMDLEEALIRNLEGVKQKQAEIVTMWFDERKHDAKVIGRNASAVLSRNINDKAEKLPGGV